MRPHERIGARRRERGISETEAAQRSGISFNEYWDIEHQAEEAVEGADLWQVKRVCAALGLDLLELFDIKCAFCEEHQPFRQEYLLPRNDLVRKTREALGITASELGDRLGFFETSISEMETNPEFLESWSINLNLALASELKLPVQMLLGVRCRKCGH